MKLAFWLVNTFDYIAIEDLKVMFMLANHKLARSAVDASFGMFKQLLAYQAYKHQTKLVFVDPKYTTQDCSFCGYRVKKTLADRVHECPKCGLILDRDVNAAINILHKGTKEFLTTDVIYCVATQDLRWDSANVKLPENGASVSEMKLVSDSSDVCERRSHSLQGMVGHKAQRRLAKDLNFVPYTCCGYDTEEFRANTFLVKIIL